MTWNESSGILSLSGWPVGTHSFLINGISQNVTIAENGTGEILFNQSNPEINYTVRIETPPEGFLDQRIVFSY